MSSYRILWSVSVASVERTGVQLLPLLFPSSSFILSTGSTRILRATNMLSTVVVIAVLDIARWAAFSVVIVKARTKDN